MNRYPIRPEQRERILARLRPRLDATAQLEARRRLDREAWHAGYQGFADAEWLHTVGFGPLDDDEFTPAPLRPSTDYLPPRRNVARLAVLTAIASVSLIGFAALVAQCASRYPR